MFEQAIRLLEGADRIILHRHSHPDGDALGAQTGLFFLLADNFPGKELYCVGDEAGRYAFMARSTMDTVPDKLFPAALAVVLDCSAEHLISDPRWKTAGQTLRIDHHLFCGALCETELIDSSFESCAGMIAALALEAGWRISLPAATALYTGIVTDSGRFRYDCVSARTLGIAGRLLEQPVDTTSLYGSLYQDTLENLKLRSSFITRIERTPHGVAYLYNDRALLEGLGLETASVSRGMVGTMADLAGIPIWVNFTECEGGGVDCELRSSLYNINPVAVAFGGGGHPKASGAHVEGREKAMEMLAALDRLAEENA